MELLFAAADQLGASLEAAFEGGNEDEFDAGEVELEGGGVDLGAVDVGAVHEAGVEFELPVLRLRLEVGVCVFLLPFDLLVVVLALRVPHQVKVHLHSRKLRKYYNKDDPLQPPAGTGSKVGYGERPN
jgi:hypothetical protein